VDIAPWKAVLNRDMLRAWPLACGVIFVFFSAGHHQHAGNARTTTWFGPTAATAMDHEDDLEQLWSEDELVPNDAPPGCVDVLEGCDSLTHICFDGKHSSHFHDVDCCHTCWPLRSDAKRFSFHRKTWSPRTGSGHARPAAPRTHTMGRQHQTEAPTAPRQHQTKSPTERQKAVAAAMQWAWRGYKESAWGSDELHPVSQTSSDWFGLGLTLVDSLDTLWLMGLNDEFDEAREWVAAEWSPKMTKVDPPPHLPCNHA
jgi:hypothetical protein